MAAHSGSFIRVRLHFDYPPPAVIGCRMCWLLVDLRSCRVVADLESIIREKFEFSRGSILSLFVEDCYLPHTESVLVVRDNDCVRVKVDTASIAKKQTSPESTSENNRKRRRPAEENGCGESGLSLEFKKKKRKKSVTVTPTVNGLQTETEETTKTPRKQRKDKKKKKEKEEKRKSVPPVPPKPSPSVKKTPNSKEKVVKSTKASKNSSSSDSSDSSEDEQPPKKAPPTKPVTKDSALLTTTPTAPKTTPNGRPTIKKLPPPTSSSSSSSDADSSSSEEAKSSKATSADAKSKTPSTDIVQASSGIPNDSSSDEELQLVIRKPLQQPPGRIVVGQPPRQQQQAAGRGRGRGKAAPREWNKGRGNCIEYNYRDRERNKKEASYSTDSLSNVSVVIQNQNVLENAAKPDYSSMPLLAAPPQVGQKIAFKLLELTENYTPEVSDYKEAKILAFDPTSKQIELELLTASQAPVEPGKFDLVYQNPDGSERVEYAVERESLVTERWDSLLEPRLII